MADPGAMPDWVLWVGGGVGTVISTVILRMGWKAGEPQKVTAKNDAMIAAVGMGFGMSAEQGNQLIAAVKEVAEAIRDDKQEARDKKQAEIQEGQEEIQETLADVLAELKRRPPG